MEYTNDFNNSLSIGETNEILISDYLKSKGYNIITYNKNYRYDLYVEKDNKFNKIEIKTVYREPTYEVVDGMLVVKDNSTSEIIMNDEIIEAIRKQVYEIRENVIN
jgi:Holliday junction resolvase-like predicted endonuclease